MRRTFFLLLILFIVSLCFGDSRIWQRDWYLGSGETVSDSVWGFRYFRGESLNVEDHMIVFMSNDIDPENWITHQIYEGSGSGGHYQFPIYGDISRSGHVDLITLEVMELVWYQSEGSFDSWRRIVIDDLGEGGRIYGGGAKVHDMNRNGWNDIILGCEEGLFIFYNNGDETFTKFTVDTTFDYHEIEIADIDQDGLPDIVTTACVGAGSTGPLLYFRQNEDGTFRPVLITSRSGHWRVNTGDFTGNGYPDVFTSGWKLQCFHNNGDGTFTEAWDVGITNHERLSFDGSNVADFNKNGHLDFLAVSASTGGGLFIIYNDGEGFIDTMHIHSDYPRAYMDACIASDITLNGTYDVIGGHTSVGIALWNEDTEEFDYHTAGSVSNSHHVESFRADYKCGVMKHLLARCNSGYFLFENRMLSFKGGGFLESSVLNLAYGQEPNTFGWIDCVPEGFEVNYSYRSGETVEACTTSEFIPIINNGDPVEGYCGGYFQYRVDFIRTTGRVEYSPRVDSVYLEVISCGCYLELNRLSFLQDTICDGEHWIDICYDAGPTCQDSSYYVDVIASSDGGATWDVPLETIIDTTGALGDAPRMLRYCFSWNLSADLPDFAGEILFRPIVRGDDVNVVVISETASFYVDGLGPDVFARVVPPVARPLSSLAIVIDSLRDPSGIKLEESFMRIEGCEISDSISLTEVSDGTELHYELPYINCDSAMVIFYTIDEYCNYSWDTLYFSIVNEAPRIIPCHTSLIRVFYGDTLDREISVIDESEEIDLDVWTVPSSEISFTDEELTWVANDTGIFNIYIVATDLLELSDTCIMTIQVLPAAVHEDPRFLSTPNMIISPNPFQGESNIYLSNIPQGTIEVFNIRGELVQRIDVRPNTDRIPWRPDRLVSGKYFIRLKAGDIEIEREVTITR